jgi:hypothetical protein
MGETLILDLYLCLLYYHESRIIRRFDLKSTIVNVAFGILE